MAALLPRLTDKRVITYGLQDGADYQAVQIRREGERTRFAVQRLDPVSGKSSILGEVGLALPGRHNVSNALAAIAVALELEIPWPVIDQSLDQYKGVRRRFDLLCNTPERVIIDDYAHHPTEIAATLQGVREGFGTERRLVALFQPHRYSRVQSLLPQFLSCFRQADLVLVDRIHPAGESPLAHLTPDAMRQQLLEGIAEQSEVVTFPLPDGDFLQQGRSQLEEFLLPGDVVVFLGAGSITKKARNFAEA